MEELTEKKPGVMLATDPLKVLYEATYDDTNTRGFYELTTRSTRFSSLAIST